MAPQQFAWIIVNFLLLTFVSYKVCTAAQLKFTNLQCEAVDQSLWIFRECRLRLISRGVPTLNTHLKLFRPINALWLNFAIYKKASGYKPFLYNVSTDICEFLKNTSKNMLFKILLNFVAGNSNVNHSCPYRDAIIVKNLVLTEDKFRLIPLPSGEYMVKLIARAEGQGFAIAKTYFTRIE